MKAHRAGIVAAAVALGVSVTPLSGVAFASTLPASSVPTKLLTCEGTTVSRPSSFVISCADGNSELSATRWKTWTENRATGTTTFGLNLCVPYCAASKISQFKDSTVVLTAPESTKHGKIFSKLVVTYTVKGKAKSFVQSWSGDPAFKK